MDDWFSVLRVWGIRASACLTLIVVGWMGYESWRISQQETELLRSPAVVQPATPETPTTATVEGTQPSVGEVGRAAAEVAPPLTTPLSPTSSKEARSRPVAATSSVLSEAELRDQAIGSAVQLVTREQNPLGSGVVVAITPDSFEVLTAAHLLKDRTGYQLKCLVRLDAKADPTVYTHRAIKVMRYDATVDLALLRVLTSIVPYAAVEKVQSSLAPSSFPHAAWRASWSDSKLPEFEEVTMLRRVAARRTNLDPLVSYWQLEQASAGGMSGGALLDPNGKLLGIASGNSGGKAYYCDDREIAKFLGLATP